MCAPWLMSLFGGGGGMGGVDSGPAKFQDRIPIDGSTEIAKRGGFNPGGMPAVQPPGALPMPAVGFGAAGVPVTMPTPGPLPATQPAVPPQAAPAPGPMPVAPAAPAAAPAVPPAPYTPPMPSAVPSFVGGDLLDIFGGGGAPAQPLVPVGPPDTIGTPLSQRPSQAETRSMSAAARLSSQTAAMMDKIENGPRTDDILEDIGRFFSDTPGAQAEMLRLIENGPPTDDVLEKIRRVFTNVPINGR